MRGDPGLTLLAYCLLAVIPRTFSFADSFECCVRGREITLQRVTKKMSAARNREIGANHISQM
jgi:hypothetical protein